MHKHARARKHTNMNTYTRTRRYTNIKTYARPHTPTPALALTHTRTHTSHSENELHAAAHPCLELMFVSNRLLEIGIAPTWQLYGDEYTGESEQPSRNGHDAVRYAVENAFVAVHGTFSPSTTCHFPTESSHRTTPFTHETKQTAEPAIHASDHVGL